MIQLVHYVAFAVNSFDSDRLFQVISDSFDYDDDLIDDYELVLKNNAYYLLNPIS